MDFIDDLENNSILLIPYNIKEKVLEYMDKKNILKSIKIMTFNDLKKGLLFDYNNEAIYKVMEEYNVNYEIAKSYINSLYFIEDISYTHDKLKKLAEIKQLLKDYNLLIYDKLLLSLIKSKNVLYIWGFDYIDKFNNYLLDIIKSHINIEYIKKETNDYKHNVLTFNKMDKEIMFVAEEISKLISNGIDINKIHISNYSNDYYFTINSIFKSYGIPFSIKSETTLYTTAIGSYFIENLDLGFDSVLSKISKKFDVENNNHNELVYNSLFNLANNYYWCTDISKIKNMIVEEMKSTTLPTSHMKYEIKSINITDNFFEDDEYIFLIGFNSNYPKLKKDVDYIDDKLKPEFMDTSLDYNKKIKEIVKTSLKNIKNITITCCLASNQNTYEENSLIDNDYLLKEPKDIEISFFNDEINKLNLASKIDTLSKFNVHDSIIDDLYSNYEIPYKEYDNSFKGIDINLLRNYINERTELDKFSFSYSNISIYYKCPFQYYISYILRVREYEQTLDQFIGSLFHHVLEVCLKDDTKSIEDVYNKYVLENINEEIDNNKGRFFINALRDETKFVIETIREQYSHGKINNAWYEEDLHFELDRNIKAVVKGIVDKVLFVDNHALIVDYKTNNKSLDKDLFEYGIDIQLPIYLYFLRYLHKDITVQGMYLQHILNLDNPYNKDKDYITEMKNNMKLDGFTFNDNNIELFDDTYEKSEIIESLSVKDGEIKETKKVITLDDKERIILLMEKLILDCIDNVSDAKFDIKPIKIDSKKVDGCKYCSYKDICYRKPKDFNEITIDKGDK